ncbi:MAG: HlyD family efflux transporter periplasmic adaptor subunit [Zetaproteobacteria bacterium]|nr:HlyD family efflux transporter periplasmic adaptor subunit [Zetaproteobacteria bacterium]
MWFNRSDEEEDGATQARIQKLQSYHTRHHGFLLFGLSVSLAFFTVWSMEFRIDEVAKASGEVIASSRVQVIQAVDGGVLSELLVREGDVVEPGQLLASLDQTRVGASVGEIDARLFSLKARAIRLRAEVVGEKEMVFPASFRKRSINDIAKVEEALFQQRRRGLEEDIRTLKVSVQLSQKELQFTEQLSKRGDASGSELLRAQRALNEAEAKLINRRNQFLEDARSELSKVEDDIAQNEQILAKRLQEQKDSVFTALVRGIVKNIRVTTVGGVLRAGDELMQIVPIDDDLIIEAKVLPADIAKIHNDLEATIRFDPFDYTIYGVVKGKVIYVSADTLKEDTNRGKEIYYRVHVSPDTTPVISSVGKPLNILPGMTAQVDIRTGDRTLMDYLLKPLRKTLSESFGER